MITPGGEIAFVKRMLVESLSLKTRCRRVNSSSRAVAWASSEQSDGIRLFWGSFLLFVTLWKSFAPTRCGDFSMLCGSLFDESAQIDNYAVTELVQGQTRRWVVAWSFEPQRLPDVSDLFALCARIDDSLGKNLARPASQSLRPYAPPTNETRQAFSASASIISSHLLDILAPLVGIVSTPLGDASSSERQTWRVTASQNSWSRTFRRRRTGTSPHSASVSDSPEKAMMVCDLTVLPPSEAADACSLLGSWREGRFRADFESFWNHITRKLTASVIKPPASAS